MMVSLWSAATGMQSQELKQNVISNNLANIDTVGYKKSRVSFQDTLYQTKKTAGSTNSAGSVLPTGIQVGNGVRVIGTGKLYTQGSVMETGNSMDFMIEGDGFFQILMPDGTLGYTRNGEFKFNSERQIVNSDGFPLEPAIVVPEDAQDFSLGEDGTITVTRGNEKTVEELGNIELVRFVNPQGLSNIGKNLLKVTSASGAAQAGTPGDSGYGLLTQGSLEGSNVTMVDEMVKMIVSQRAYEVNSKSIQTADTMLQQATELKR